MANDREKDKSTEDDKTNTLILRERSFNHKKGNFSVTYTREEIKSLMEKFFPHRSK